MGIWKMLQIGGWGGGVVPPKFSLPADCQSFNSITLPLPNSKKLEFF